MKVKKKTHKCFIKTLKKKVKNQKSNRFTLTWSKVKLKSVGFWSAKVRNYNKPLKAFRLKGSIKRITSWWTKRSCKRN